MQKPVRKTEMLLLVAMINAGCAQMSGTYVPAESASPLSTLAWPNPSIETADAPLPPEQTPVPEIAMPANKQDDTAMLSRATAARKVVAAPRAAPRVAAKPVVAGHADIWQRVRSGYQMNTAYNSLVPDWEKYYSSRPDYFAQMIRNSSYFLYHIVSEVERRGMPQEIALLPMIESAFNPVAYSSAHASGIWQFIPSTGKSYGLRQNSWYDGRRDVIAATNAALDYLQTLHLMFNDWELALAAYNWGEGAVQRAIERNQARGLPTDYQSLYAGMPAETRNYVPKLLAVKNLIGNPAAYAIALAHVPNEPYFETIKVRRHIDVALAARFASMSMEEFRFLNPAHNKPVINANTAETILIPRNRLAMFNAAMAQHETQPLVSMKTHVVRAGELPEAIAAQYDISVAELNDLNGIGPRRRIMTGQSLTVPNRNDLQPALADFPTPTNIVAAATRAVYTRAVPLTRQVVVIRNGVRRTVAMAAPVHRVVNRGRPAVVIRNTVALRPAAARKVIITSTTVRPLIPVVRIRNR